MIKLLWEATEDKKVAFKGRYFELDQAGSPLKPTSKIPMYVASYGPKMLDITAKLADGWIPESHTPETYEKTLSKIYRSMKEVGRDPDNLEPCCAVIFYPWEPSKEAYSRLIKAARVYLASYPDIPWTLGVGKDYLGARLHDLSKDDDLWERLASLVPEQLADSTLVYGNKEGCMERLVRLREAGCKHIILEPKTR